MMKRSTVGLAGVVTIGAVTGLLSACGDDSTGPSGTVDASLASEVLADLSLALAQNPAWVSFSALSPYIAQIGGQPAPPYVSRAPERIPASALGATFVWDVDMAMYVEDPARTGAPADGARFILYTINQSTFQPVVPLNEIGSVDVRDLSSGQNIDIRHAASIGSSATFDVDLSGTLTGTSANLTSNGSVSSGNTTVDFTYVVQGSVGGALTLSIEATSGPYSVDWSYVRNGQGGVGPGSDRLTITDSQSSAKVEFIVDWDAFDVVVPGAVVEFNDVVIADVTGTGGFIVVEPRSGSGLDENDGYLLASGYFDALNLNGVMISVTRLALEDTGRTLPYF